MIAGTGLSGRIRRRSIFGPGHGLICIALIALALASSYAETVVGCGCPELTGPARVIMALAPLAPGRRLTIAAAQWTDPDWTKPGWAVPDRPGASGPGASGSGHTGSSTPGTPGGDVGRLMKDAAEEQLSVIDTRGIQEFIDGLDGEIAQHMPKFDLHDIISNSGSHILDPVTLARSLGAFLLGEVRLNLFLLGELIVVAVVCSLLSTLGEGLGGEGPSSVAWAVCYMVIVAMGVNSFRVAAGLASGAVDKMVSFMYALMPSLTALLAASGGVTSAAIVSPLMLGATSVVSTVVKTTVIPLLLLSITLSLVGDISGRKQVSRLAALLRSWSLLVLGLSATLFVAVAGVRGGLASVSDVATAKAVKFLSSNMIPVVGKVFGDAVDLVASSSLLIRGALGLFGLAALAVICLYPVLKLIAIMFMFRIGSAVVQPLGDKRVSDCLAELADGLSALCVSVGTVGLMFFICIALIAGLAGGMAGVAAVR